MSLKKTKTPESTDAVAEAKALLAELGAEIGTAQVEVSQSIEEALARRDELAGENKRMALEVRKLTAVAAKAAEMLATDLPVNKRTQLEDKAKQIRDLLASAQQEFGRNAGELADLEANPAVYGAMQEQAAKENIEKDPLAPYEDEIKLQKKAVNDILVKIVDLWKKDNGRALFFQSEALQYSEAELQDREALNHAKQRLKEVRERLAKKKYLKGKLESEQAELEETIKIFEEKVAGWENKVNATYKESQGLENNLRSAVEGYERAMYKMNDVIQRGLPSDQREKLKSKVVPDTHQKVLDEFPVYAHGPSYYVDHQKLFEKLGYKREVPKRAGV